MKSKKSRSMVRRFREMGQGGMVLVGAAFQQLPFGVGMVVSLGLHGVAMPSVIAWVQRETPTPPESVSVVELDETDLAQLPPAMREEAMASTAEESQEGGWDWFTSRSGSDSGATSGSASVPKAQVPKTSGRSLPPAASSERSTGGWRSSRTDRGEDQGEFLARWRRRLALAQRRAELQERQEERRRSQQRSEASDDQKAGTTGDTDDKEGTGQEQTDGETRRSGDEENGGEQAGDQGDPGESAGTEGGATDVLPELPEGLRDRLAQLQESSWEHDGRASGDRKQNFGNTLVSDEFNPWRNVVIANQLKDEEGKVPDAVEDQYWLTYTPEQPLTVPVPSALLCTLSPAPDPVRVAMLGGPDGKFVPEESPKLLTSSGYGQLDGQALEWMYRNLRAVPLTPYQGYIIHLLTLSFPTCDASNGASSGGETE